MVAAAADYEHHVTPRELFFDLVFVFAFTQVATLIVGIVLFAFAIKTIVGTSATSSTRSPRSLCAADVPSTRSPFRRFERGSSGV